MNKQQQVDRALMGDEGYNRYMLACILENVMGGGVFDDSADETARRILKYWKEFSPLAKGAADFEFTTFPAEGKTSMVLVKDIDFVSMCSHHFLPFKGVAHVAYIPDQKLVGLSKIPRTVEWYARMPQMQESLTRMVASALQTGLEPAGVAVVMEAQHTCLSCRGARNAGASMVTADLTGLFIQDRVRAEFYSHLQRGGR